MALSMRFHHHAADQFFVAAESEIVVRRALERDAARGPAKVCAERQHSAQQIVQVELLHAQLSRGCIGAREV